MRFEHPYLLWLLPLGLPLLIAFFWWALRKKRQLITQFVSARLLSSLTVGMSAGRQKVRIALVVVAVALLIVALARPQLGFSWEEARSRGLDIVVAIDTSRSMLATDVAPNRLQRAKLESLNLKKLARTDRLGLVAFAGSAFLQSPLTLDDEAFRQSVELLDVNIIPQGGTALAEAIHAAKSAFKEGNDNHRVLVLFTDGEDHDGHAVEVAKEAGKDGLRIFTVGVGTPNGEVLRLTDSQGRTEFLKDAEGNAVRSRLDETLLRELAQATGGFYLPLSGANTMNLLYERGLAPLPKSDLASQKIKRHHERYQWLLGMALVLLLAEMLLPERKPAKAAEASTAATGDSTPAKVALFVALLAWPALTLASPTKGLKQYQSGKYDHALTEYERALNKKPDDPRLHFNAGAAAFQGRDYESALSHWYSALLTPDLKLQQQSYYNIGNTLFRLGEDAGEPDKKKSVWEQAVKSYESALKLDPKDSDAEFNREFVQKKLEELQQQQQDQQNNKDQDKDQNQQKDQNKQDQSKDQQKKEQQKQEQQKQDQQKQQQDQPQQQKPEDHQSQEQKKQQAKQGGKDGEKKEGQQSSESKDKPEDQNEKEAQPQGVAAIRMTPQQAMQLLDTLKGDEKTMPFRPMLRTNRNERVFKDW